MSKKNKTLYSNYKLISFFNILTFLKGICVTIAMFSTWSVLVDLLVCQQELHKNRFP